MKSRTRRGRWRWRGRGVWSMLGILDKTRCSLGLRGFPKSRSSLSKTISFKFYPVITTQPSSGPSRRATSRVLLTGLRWRTQNRAISTFVGSQSAVKSILSAFLLTLCRRSTNSKDIRRSQQSISCLGIFVRTSTGRARNLKLMIRRFCSRWCLYSSTSSLVFNRLLCLAASWWIWTRMVLFLGTAAQTRLSNGISTRNSLNSNKFTNCSTLTAIVRIQRAS